MRCSRTRADASSPPPHPIAVRAMHVTNGTMSRIAPILCSGDMTLQRMDNVLIVVEDLEAAKAFFAELGMELEGETTVEGPWVGATIGLKDVRADITMM